MLKAMKSRVWFCTPIALWAFSVPQPAGADTQFRARQMTRTDVPADKGQCDIRLQIDAEAEVSVRGDLVHIRTISGRDGRDDGSECNVPLPARDVQGFRFEVADGRGEIRLLSPPSRRSGYQAVVYIRDSAAGEGRYHFRLSWIRTGGGVFPGDLRDDFPGRRRDDDFSQSRGGLAWNNTIHYSGRGRGSSVLSGYGSQSLSDASVDIDRGGKILVTFRTDSGRPLNLTGYVIASEGDTLRADVATDDAARLRGSMYLARDARGEVYRITLEATDGQSRLHLDWSRR